MPGLYNCSSRRGGPRNIRPRGGPLSKSYSQIKNLLVPPAKRTASMAQKWLAKLPSLPVWPQLVAKIGLALLLNSLTGILVTGLFMPTIPITYGLLVAGIVVFLSAYTLYEDREKIAKTLVMVLAAL